MADAGRVERHYGDLDKLYEEDRLAEALKAEIPGVADKGRAAYRTAVRRYREYRRETVDPVDGNDDGARERIFGLERDLQAALRDRDCIEQLEPGLEITDGGAERSVASGFIDITAKAPDGTVVVIELKAGTAHRAAIGQILSYMGDVAIITTPGRNPRKHWSAACGARQSRPRPGRGRPARPGGMKGTDNIRVPGGTAGL